MIRNPPTVPAAQAPPGASVNALRLGRNRRGRSRSGTAAVEFAVCLPILAALVFGAIEVSGLIHMQHALQTVAYETARTAVRPHSENSTTLDYGTERLAQTDVVGGQITIVPGNLWATAAGTPVTVSVSAPLDANRLIPPWFVGSGTYTATCTMLKE